MGARLFSCLLMITVRPEVYCKAKQSGHYSKYDLATDHLPKASFLE